MSKSAGIAILTTAAAIYLTSASTPAAAADSTPDLSGTYNVATLTPLQRPKRFEGKATISAEEAKEISEYWANNLAKDAAPSDPNRGAPEKGGTEIYVPEFEGAAGGVGGYNAFYVDIGESNFMIDGKYPTSIITAPENGRLPVRHWYTTMASDQRSLRKSTSRVVSICSGLM